MIIEGVNFNGDIARKLDREAFVSLHLPHLWRDKDEATRQKMLEYAYDLLNPPKKGKKKAEE